MDNDSPISQTQNQSSGQMNGQPVTMPQLPKKHKTASFFVAIIMSVLLVFALGFGVWAFVGMLENQTNLDEKIDAASQVAVQIAEADKEVEFTEREKNPFKTYQGSATYGSLEFDYPKNWSVFAETSDSGTLLDFYAQPEIIPGFTDTNFAFRAQIVDKEYESELQSFDSKAKRGTVKVSAFRLENVPDQLGAVVTGEIDGRQQGTLILLPQRDKTIKLFTETEDYLADFAKIVESTTYSP